MNNQVIYLVLHNIRSAYNVGAILRTADAAGVTKVFVCGISPKPDSPQVIKTALGAEKTIYWEYHHQAVRLIKKLKNEDYEILALELDKDSINIFKYKTRHKKLVLIVGNEIRGLNKKILSLSDKILEIPMRGTKESLNVAVAAGIAVYRFLD